MKKSKDAIIRDLKRELVQLQQDQLKLLNLLDRFKKGEINAAESPKVKITGGGI